MTSTQHKALEAAKEALIGHGAECKEVNDALALIDSALAAPDLQAELDATNKQVEILSDALAESRREVAALKAVQEPWKYRRWDDAKEQWELTDDSGWPSEPVYTTPPAAQHQRVVFPTMLRKMWSGSEVQAWLDEHVNKGEHA
jgi:hypothetical protein